MTRAEDARRIEMWEKWNHISVEAQGDWRGRQAKTVESKGSSVPRP